MTEYTHAWCETCQNFKPAKRRELDYGGRRFQCRDCKEKRK